MDDLKTGIYNGTEGESSPIFDELLKSETSLLEMDSFETIEAVINSSEKYENDLVGPDVTDNDLLGSFEDNEHPVARPFVSIAKDFLPEIPKHSPEFTDYVNMEKHLTGHDFTVITGEEKKRHSAEESQPCSGDGNHLSIGLSSGSQSVSEVDPPFTFGSDNTTREKSCLSEVTSNIKVTKIGVGFPTETKYHEEEISASQASAQSTPREREVDMESDKVGLQNSDNDCPFSPGAWFNPNKLHPVVAKYVHWQDPKQSALALTISLVFLFSFKFFSVISVTAYLIIAILSITVTFRIYKNVLQAIQKSNDGHPFKEYLDLDITLSQDKVSETVETFMQHLNCVSGKLRSLILVEDLVDTIKLAIFAWMLTYVGAWFNGLTIVILAVVSAFTLPKIYDLNKAQIDTYAVLVCTKGKEVIDMVNAKMPMGKKKDQ